MATQPTPPKSAAQYLAEAKAFTKPTVKAPAPDLSELKATPFGGGAKKGPQDPVSWLTDILSRPLYAVTDQFKAAIDSGADAVDHLSKGDVGGAVKAVVDDNLKHNAVKGFFSTDEANKNTTSDLIEDATDTVGKHDPNYVDRKNNVNEILKGTLGFAGDLAFDPTTYIPGAQIAKGLNIAAKAVKGLSEGGKVAVDAIKAAKKGEKVADDLATDVPITVENAVDSAAAKSEPVVDTTPDAPEALPEPTAAEQLVGHVRGVEKKAILAIGNPKHADIKTALASLKPFEREPLVKAAADPANAKPLAFKDWLDGANKEFDKLFEIKPDTKITDAKKLGGLKVGDEVVSLPIAIARAQKGDAPALEALGAFHRGYYTKGFLAKAAEGKLISPLGKEIKPVSAPVVDASKLSELEQTASKDLADVDAWNRAVEAPDELAPYADAATGNRMTNAEWIQKEIEGHNEVATDGFAQHDHSSVLDWMINESDKSQAAFEAAQQAADPGARTVLNSLQAFKSNARGDEAFIRGALGNDLVDNLQQFTNPAQFDKTVSNLSAIMNGSINVTALKEIKGTSARLLERLGFENPGSIPEEINKLRDAVGEPLPTAKGKIDTRALLDSMNTDDVPQEFIDLSNKVLTETTMKNVVAIKNPVDFPYTTSYEKAARTDKELGQGTGNIGNEWNTYTQADAFYATLNNSKRAVETLPGVNPKALFGATFARAKSAAVRQSLRLSERALDAQGIPMTLGVGFNNGAEKVLLGQSQVLDILNGVDANLLDVVAFNKATSVPITNLYDAVFAAVHGGTDDEIKALLANVQNAYGTKTFENRMMHPEVTTKGSRQYSFGTKVYKPGELLDPVAAMIRKAVPQLQKTVELNAAAHEARGLSETMKMTNEQLQYLEEMYAKPGGFSDLLQAVADTGTRVVDEAKKIGALDESTLKTGAVLSGSIPAGDMATAKAAVKTAEAAAKVFDPKDIREMERAGAAIAQEKYEAITKATALATDSPTLDIGEITQRNMAKGFFAAFAPLSRVFGNKLLHDDYREVTDMLQGVLQVSKDSLTKFDKAFDPETKRLAMYALQKGTASSTPEVAAAMEQLRPLVEQVFGSAENFSLKDNGFFREGNSLYHLNAVLDQKGLGEFLIDVDAAQAASKASGKSLIDEAAAQWMNHSVADPTEYMNKMFSAFAQINAHHVLAMDAVMKAKQYGAFSNVPKEGFVRMVNDSGKSVLASYFPREIYIEKNVAEQIGVVDSLLRETLDLGGPIGGFVRNVYKPALDMFKTGMTIINPAHHVRNALSDMDLTRNAEGFTTKPIYKWAMEALATHNSYDQFDAIAALNGIHARPKPGRTLFKGGLAKEGVSPADLYTAMAGRGALPNYKRLENLDELQSQSLAGRIETSLQNTKVIRAAGALSEANSHWTRLAHAAQFVEKNINNTKEYKSLDELYEAAAQRVKKWHPDGSDLSQFDQIARLIIPFYSWQRKSIPLVLETFLLHPARAQVLPKASYNLAVAMGVNPDSLNDPFPDDQMFPSYLTGQTFGPQFKVGGKYYGINPGFATSGTLDTYLSGNPLQSILGQVSPFIRAPFELATGTNVGTGSRINDLSDYFDSQLPVVAPVSRLTGNSVTGSILSTLQGKGLDPQYQIAAGNKDPGVSAATALANYLSGAGVTPMSQQNQINYAEIEKRNAAAKESK